MANSSRLLYPVSCIDAGDPASDWRLEASPTGSRVNMGAYGNTPESSKSPGSGSVYFVR